MSDTEGVISEFLVFPTFSEEESHEWTHQNTLIFLELYMKYREQVGSMRIKNLKKMFEEIAKEIKRITKTGITGTNCENRWKVLDRNYKEFIDNSKLTGRGRKVFEYAEIMHSILEQKKMYPVLLLSSDTINTPSEASADDKENEIEMGIEPSEPNVKR
ncbi:hypothetical protein JTB14_027572 [Gonioctena quinquepunctata]|nr:hypothetical protein JTB14_027572 [Gonioctena quinquepunctata]